MNRNVTALALMVLVAGAACSRNGNGAADTTLNRDLSLAAQQRATLDSLNAAERSAGATAQRTALAPTTTVHHTSSGGTVVRTHHSGTSSSPGTTTTTTTSSSGTVEKHTQRDAAIGAGAGAVIGAVTSKNKVKGGLIGAAVGGILGGVIGNNVDKKKKP
jgi:hypothetical protein